MAPPLRHSIPGVPLSGRLRPQLPALPWVFRETALCTIGVEGCAQYLPPVFNSKPPVLTPPQTIICVTSPHRHVRTSSQGCAHGRRRYPTVGVALYRPPVFKAPVVVPPAQMIISLPVHTPVCALRGEGALARLVATQLSLTGLYRPPVFVQWKEFIHAAPDDHFTPGPHCGEIDTARERRVRDCRRRPSICGGIVSAASAQRIRLIGSTPDDHLTPGPERFVVPSCRRRVDGAHRRPTVGS